MLLQFSDYKTSTLLMPTYMYLNYTASNTELCSQARSIMRFGVWLPQYEATALFSSVTSEMIFRLKLLNDIKSE